MNYERNLNTISTPDRPSTAEKQREYRKRRRRSIEELSTSLPVHKTTMPPVHLGVPRGLRATGCIKEPLADDALLFGAVLEPTLQHRQDLITQRLFRIAHSRIINQGILPVDVAAAWWHWLALEPGRLARLPPMHTFMLEAYTIDGYADVQRDAEGRIQWRGSTLYAMAEVIRRRGYIQEHVWTTDADQVLLWIEHFGPLVVATDWYAGMSPIRPEQAEVSGEIESYHAYVILGWSVTRRAFRILNSHGLPWGHNSCKWLDYDDLAFLLQTGGVAVTGTDKRGGAIARSRAFELDPLHTIEPSDIATVHFRNETLQMLGLGETE